MAQLICHHLSVGYDSKAVLTDLNNSWIAKARGRPDYGGRWDGAK